MNAVAAAQVPASTQQLDRAVAELLAGRRKLARLSLDERAALLADCLDRVAQLAPEWVELACDAKGLPAGSTLRGEEVAAGPLATARHLRLLLDNYRALAKQGHIPLPTAPTEAADGSLRVTVMPTRGLFDTLVFSGFKATAWMEPRVKRADLDRLGSHLVNPPQARTVLVLGAGNVSSIPPTDAISKIFQEGHVVLLKMNPVNEYLGGIFERLFAKLIEAGFLRIIYGGADVGAAAVNHRDVDEVHITGSIYSHDAIVWGPPGPDRDERKRSNRPLLNKPITSELGNVSPWIVVPGKYSEAQLRFQAENVAASIVNNASFNCVATKVIVTWRDWPQRKQFLDLVEQTLKEVPWRKAYYPGAQDRFAKFAGQRGPEDAQGRLPWTLLRDADPHASPQLFCEESFVCVCAEIGLQAESEQAFLPAAVNFANDRLWGTLSAAVTVPSTFRKDPETRQIFERAVADLRHGTIGINHWPALVYAMMSPPWGGYPSATLADAQSGIGSVHNTYMLEGVQKTVLEGPLVVWPKPFWFPTHRAPEPLAWKVLALYHQPSAWKIPGLLFGALGG